MDTFHLLHAAEGLTDAERAPHAPLGKSQLHDPRQHRRIREMALEIRCGRLELQLGDERPFRLHHVPHARIDQRRLQEPHDLGGQHLPLRIPRQFAHNPELLRHRPLRKDRQHQLPQLKRRHPADSAGPAHQHRSQLRTAVPLQDGQGGLLKSEAADRLFHFGKIHTLLVDLYKAVDASLELEGASIRRHVNGVAHQVGALERKRRTDEQLAALDRHLDGRERLPESVSATRRHATRLGRAIDLPRFESEHGLRPLRDILRQHRPAGDDLHAVLRDVILVRISRESIEEARRRHQKDLLGRLHLRNERFRRQDDFRIDLPSQRLRQHHPPERPIHVTRVDGGQKMNCLSGRLVDRLTVRPEG